MTMTMRERLLAKRAAEARGERWETTPSGAGVAPLGFTVTTPPSAIVPPPVTEEAAVPIAPLPITPRVVDIEALVRIDRRPEMCRGHRLALLYWIGADPRLAAEVTPFADPGSAAPPTPARAAVEHASEDCTPKRIAALRERTGLDRSAFAVQLGVSYNAVWNWETDASGPRASGRTALAALATEVGA